MVDTSAMHKYLGLQTGAGNPSLLGRYNGYTRALDQFAVSPALTEASHEILASNELAALEPRAPATGAKAHATTKEVAGPWGFCAQTFSLVVLCASVRSLLNLDLRTVRASK